MSNSVDQIFTDELAALAKEGYSEAEIMEAAPMILAEVQKASGAPGPYRSGYQFPTQAQQQPKKTLDPLRNAILRNKIAKTTRTWRPCANPAAVARLTSWTTPVVRPAR